uniref:Uncharacterized protein n=1 Tax=Rhizophora mucronata TaxID=61149 RepID=A0A2P2P414_RHIMU
MLYVRSLILCYNTYGPSSWHIFSFWVRTRPFCMFWLSKVQLG